MRRITRLLLVALLLTTTATCATRPGSEDPGPRSGTTAGDRDKPPLECYEAQRRRCDTYACRGPNLDYVIIRCNNGQQLTRCETNLSCRQ